MSNIPKTHSFSFPFSSSFSHSKHTKQIKKKVRKKKTFIQTSMASISTDPDELLYDYSPLIRVYKNGVVERLMSTETAPPSLDPQTNVQSKDITFSPQKNLSARLYLPNKTLTEIQNGDPNHQKLPLVFYFHGGAFCVATASTPHYHRYVNTLAAEANVMAISVDYRRAPEHPLPICYEDSWEALKWVASHFNGDGPEEWINLHADLERVFLTGDSSGANIAHHMAMRYGKERLLGLKLLGIVLAYPHFWGKDPIGVEAMAMDAEKRERVDAMWRFVCPGTSGSDDPLINPGKDPDLRGLGCERVLVVVAEKDFMKDRGWYYGECLRNSGWGGELEVMEAKGEDRVFHLFKPTCENAVAMLAKIVSFIYK